MRNILSFVLYFTLISLAPSDEPSTRQITVMDGTVRLNIPKRWIVSEKDGKTIIGPSERDVFDVAYLSLFEDDPKLTVDDNYLKKFLRDHTLAQVIHRLPEERFFGETEAATDSGLPHYRWGIIEATGKQEFAIVLFSYQPSVRNRDVLLQMLRVAKSARLLQKK